MRVGYCGLLDASIAAQVRARQLEPSIHTSVGHTFFLLGQYRRAREDTDQPLDASASIVLAMLGEDEAAIAETLREEARMSHGTLTLFTRALRHVLQGDASAARTDIELVERSSFFDPEGWFYLALLITRLGNHARAVARLGRSVRAGYYVASALEQNAWLAPLQPLPEIPGARRRGARPPSARRRCVRRGRWSAGAGDPRTHAGDGSRPRRRPHSDPTTPPARSSKPEA